MIDAVLAQAAPGGMQALQGLLLPTIGIIAIMYFLMIRPQQKRLKEHRAMIESIRRNDVVVTSGGIIGKVVKVDEDELQLEVAEGVRIKVLRSTISELRGKPEPAKTGTSAAKPASRSAKTAEKSEDS